MKDKVIKQLSKHLSLSKQEILDLIEIPPSPELGDYAFPCFILSKTLKKNPDEIAKEISNKIKSKEFEKVEANGPYINFFIDKTLLAKSIIKKIKKEKDKYGSQKKKEKVLIESPSPNTNKPLHLGHVRNMILAQALKRILELNGNQVKMVNVNNDRGIHICKSLVAYEKFGNFLTPESANKKPDHFVGDFYVKFDQESKKDPLLEKEAQEYLQKWEAGDKKILSLWRKMNSWACRGFNETYKKFDFHIDKDYYESKFYKLGKDIVLEQFKKGKVGKKTDGAYFVNLEKQNLGEKILLRTDGTSIYITQDLYLALLRKREFNFDKMLYVVANEQDYHFKVLFELLKLFGYSWANQLHHLSYGLVNLESGRMKSREGTVIDADDLITELNSLATKELDLRYTDLSRKEKEFRAKKIAMAALRYYFLKTEHTRDILFKPEESINFEGNTGPYLLYTYARAKSILRKAKHKTKNFKIKELSKQEKNLIMHLANFPETVQKSYEQLAPNLIANYSYQLAQAFNEFYHSERVIGSEQEDFRLSLVDCCSQVLKNSLSLLHIETLENM